MGRNVEHSSDRRLLEERLQHHWSQREVAALLGTTFVNVSRWERGVTSPSPYYRQKLCQLFGKSMSELGFEEKERGRYGSEPIWMVPYPRNPLFTGREEILQRLNDLLHARKVARAPQVQAICGLGGIGKTQIALEYVYRFQHDYRVTFWARGETWETLTTDFVAMAGLLNIPEKDVQDPKRIVEVVKDWLVSTPNWLCILDNVEDLAMISTFLPSRGNGHVVLTTRTQATGVLAGRIELLKMDQDEGALFLLRRAKLIEHSSTLAEVANEERCRAEEICQLLDGLPLALDQVGAYIEETGCTLSDYLHYYQQYRATLLSLRGQGGIDHPQSVSTTLSLSYEKIERFNLNAAHLLNLCAFLHPDAIPEEIFIDETSQLGLTPGTPAFAPLELETAIAVLRTYSLVRRNAETKTLTIHRLVQAVLKDQMDERRQRQWAEQAISLIGRVLPETSEQPAWPIYQRYLPHIEVCATLIKQWQITSVAAARLLHLSGAYLKDRWQYAEAEGFLTQALKMYRLVAGEEQTRVAKILQQLAELHFLKGEYAQARPLNQEALEIYKRTFGTEHVEIAICLNNQAMFHQAQGDYTQAEAYYREALNMRQRILEADHQDVAESLNNLAFFYHAQGKYMQAEALYQQALTIYENTQSSDSVYIARGLNNLAILYSASGRYTTAESLYLRARGIYEQALGPEHPMVAFVLHNLASLYQKQKRLEQAGRLYKQALAIREKALSPDHPDLATTLNSLGSYYFEEKQYAQALPLYERALAIREKALGPKHLRTAQSLHDLARLYAHQGQYEKAEQLYRRALHIREKVLGATHQDVATTLEHLADLLIAMRQETMAEALTTRAIQIRNSASTGAT